MKTYGFKFEALDRKEKLAGRTVNEIADLLCSTWFHYNRTWNALINKAKQNQSDRSQARIICGFLDETSILLSPGMRGRQITCPD